MAQKIDEFLLKFDEATKQHSGKTQFERALFCLLKSERDNLPQLETVEDSLRFHKNFRQIDVTDNSLRDVAIWLLIDQSEVYDKIMSDLFTESNEAENDGSIQKG